MADVVGSLLLLLVVAAGVTVAVRRGSRGDGPAGDAQTVRRVFQYLLLYGLLVVTVAGLAGLLGRLLVADLLVAGDDSALARDLAFTVVGGPLFVGAALWTRRRVGADPAEAASPTWAAYLTVASLTALVVAMTGLHAVLEWALGLAEYDGPAVARTVLWGGAWAGHLWVEARVTPPRRTVVHHLAGSLVGLVVAAVGLGGLLAATLRTLTRLGEDVVLAGSDDQLLTGLATLLVGAPVWLAYWARTAARAQRGTLWLVYVLLAGVGGGLVVALAAASTLGYWVLVWLVGDPGTTDASEYFDDAPGAAAAAAVGALVWWYHRTVLRTDDAAAPTSAPTSERTSERTSVRTEVHRVYTYLVAAIGLLAATGGIVTVLAGLVETAAGTAFVGGGPVNTLLAAVTLLGVGGPVWWLHWRRTQAWARAEPGEELASPTRRLYVLVLFGLGLVAAVIALVSTVFLVLEDVVAGDLGAETLRSTRFAVGVLLTAGVVAAYHWSIWRGDREAAPARDRGPGYVLLLGADPALGREVSRRTRGRVEVWARTEADATVWTVNEVMTALAGTTADQVVLLREPGGLRAVGVRRD